MLLILLILLTIPLAVGVCAALFRLRTFGIDPLKCDKTASLHLWFIVQDVLRAMVGS